jgi:hypothetical protein
MRINRVDVYANNCATNSFFERLRPYALSPDGRTVAEGCSAQIAFCKLPE